MPTPIVHLFRSRGTAATPGYFIADTPWAGTKTQTAGRSTDQSSARLSGGYANTGSGAINNEMTRDYWLDAGTFKVARIVVHNPSAGIVSTQFDGVTVASQDQYAASATNNNYVETTGIVVTAGLKVVKQIALSKNASSNGYWLEIQTFAIVRTGA